MVTRYLIAVSILLLSHTTAIGQLLLRGSVEHSERVPPLEKRFCPGAKVDITQLKRLTPNNFWFKIPIWAAGEWKSDDNRTAYYQYWYQSNAKNFEVDSYSLRSLGKDSWGEQKDKNGDIWTFQSTNYWNYAESQNLLLLSYVKGFEPIKVTNTEMVVVFYSVDLVVSKFTGDIIRSNQAERIQTYTPESSDLRKVDVSVKDFDHSGEPIKLSKFICIDHKLHGYKTIDKARNLFEEYLVSHGLAELVPPLSSTKQLTSKRALGAKK